MSLETGEISPPISLRPKLRNLAGHGRGRGRGRNFNEGSSQVGASCGRGFRNARGVIQCHGCGFQANSTKEFSDHDTKSQSQKIQGEGEDSGKERSSESPPSVCGTYNSTVDKQTVVDHLTTRFARIPNDMRSRITEDRRLAFSETSKRVPSGSKESKQFDKEQWQGTIPSVSLPLGKQVPATSNIPNRTEPWIQLKQQGSSKAAEELSHNHEEQGHPPSQYPYQSFWQSHPPTSPLLTVEIRRIALLERELHLQKNLDLLITKKSTIRDSNSRELYMAVLQDEIDLRKELQEVIKEKYNLEQEETLWRNREDATRPIGLEFVEEKTGGPRGLRSNNDITIAHDGLGQGRYNKGQRWEVGQTHSSLTELYDSDSEGEIPAKSSYGIQATEPATTNGQSKAEDSNNLDVEGQQRLILEQIKQDQENEKKSLDLIARLSIQDLGVQTEGQSTYGWEIVPPAKRFPSNQFPSLGEKISKNVPSAVAHGTFVEEENLQILNRGGVYQVPAGNLTRSGQRFEISERQTEQQASLKRREEVKIPLKKLKEVRLPPKSRSDIASSIFQKKMLGNIEKKEETQSRHLTCSNSDTMAEMDSERKLHAKLIKERAAAQTREGLARQKEMAVAKEWEEASKRKEKAERARLGGGLGEAGAEAARSRRSSRDRSRDKPTKEQRSKRWSSVGHGAKANPNNARNRKTSGR